MTAVIEAPTGTSQVCPDALGWCVDHDVDVDGSIWHRSRNEDRAPADEHALDIRAVLVDNADGTPGPVIWLSEPYLTPGVCLSDGIGLSPARAREVGNLLIQFANDLEGGETR